MSSMETLSRAPQTVSLESTSQAEFDALFWEITSHVGRTAVAAEAAPARQRIEGYAGRLTHLKNARFEGLSFTERYLMPRMIADIGLPVDNIRSIAHRARFPGDTPESRGETLATWEQDKGEFTTYDALNKLPEAARLATTIHELTHGTSPFRPENDFMYGSQEKREEAGRFAVAAAKQALMTGKYLNGYHRMLAEQVLTGEIKSERYYEEFSAILTELSLTNRAHVREVEAAQHAILDKRGGSWAQRKVTLISPQGADAPVGIDRTLLKLIDFDGPKTVSGIETHVRNLKTKYADANDAAKVIARAHDHDCRDHLGLAV